MTLRDQLENAKGESAQIIAIFLDIRSFSSWSQSHDAVDVGVFIAEAFKKMLDTHFPFATFTHPTGDGLLLVVSFADQASLRASARSVVNGALACVEDFPLLCDDNPLVNFKCPEDLGIGITRGSACSLVSGGEVFGYSGHRLNLAARLTDLARPSGVILDGDFGIGLLEPEVQARFREEAVYVRSLAESETHKIFVQADRVQIPERSKRGV